MRPPSRPQSALRSPLNHFLGTEANVRILRVVASTTVPLSKAAIARRSTLNPSGTARSVEELTDLGILESLGTGARRLHQLRREHPLAGILVELFTVEFAWFDSIVERLRSVVRLLTPPPRAAWIQGPVATESDEPGDPIIVGVLASAKGIDDMVESLSAHVADLERTCDVTIPVHGLTTADFSAMPEAVQANLEVTIPLLGPPPLELLSDRSVGRTATRISGHGDVDRRALIVAQAVAARLSEDPSLIERAQRYIKGRLRTASARERKEYEEWDRILRSTSLARLKRFLVEPSERATRLRQSLPFVDALSENELRLLKETE